MRTNWRPYALISTAVLLSTSSTAFAAASVDQRLLRWLMADLALEERVRTLRRLSREVGDEEWIQAREIALDVTPSHERPLVLPALVERFGGTSDAEWLAETLFSLPDKERRLLMKQRGPVRDAFARQLKQDLVDANPAVVRDALNRASWVELHRTVFAELVTRAVLDAETPRTKRLLFDYLERWRPKRYPDYLRVIASENGILGDEARERLAALDRFDHKVERARVRDAERDRRRRAQLVDKSWVPDAITRARRPDKGKTSPGLAIPRTPLALRVDHEQTDSPSSATGLSFRGENRSVADSLALDLDPSEPSGRWTLVGYSTVFGASSFGVLGDIAFDDTTTVAASAVIGGVIGGAIPYLLTLDREVSLGDSAYIASHGTWTAAAGAQGARLLELDDRSGQPSAESAVAILTGFSALVTSSLTFENAQWTLSDFSRLNGIGVQAGLASQSILTLASTSDPFRRDALSTRLAASTVAAYGLGFLPASLWAQELTLDGNDRELIAYSSTVGALSGAGFALSSKAELRGEEKLAIGALGGQAVGFVSALALTPAVDDFRATRFSVLTGVGTSAALGLAAVGPASGEPAYDRLGLVLNGGAAFAIGMGVAFPHVLEFANTKPGLLATAASFGAALGATVPLADRDLRRDETFVRASGGLALGASFGALGASLAAPYVQATPETLLSGGVLLSLGAGAGSGVGLITCDDECRSTTMGWLQGGAAVGLATALVLRKPFPTDPRSAQVGGLASLWGAWNAGLVAEWIDPGLTRADAGAVVVSAAAAGAAGSLLTDRLGLSSAELLAFDGMWGMHNFWGFSAARTFGVSDRRTTLGMVTTAPLVGLGLTHALDQVVDVDATRVGRTLGAGLVGGVAGALFAPELEEGAWSAAFGAVSAASVVPVTTLWLGEREFAESLAWSGMGNVVGVSLGALGTGPNRARASAWGGIAGLGTGFVLAPLTVWEKGDGRSLLAASATGAAQGLLFAPDDSRRAWMGIGASAGALYATIDSQWRAPLTTMDVSEATVFAALGNLTGAGLKRGVGKGRALGPSLGVGGYVAGSQFAPYTRYDSRHAFFAASLSVASAGGTALLVDGSGSPASRVEGLALAGGSLGFAAGLGLSQFHTPDALDTLEASLWGALGLSGAALLGTDAEADRTRIGAGLLAGTVVGTVAAPFTQYSQNDAALIALGTTVGAGVGVYVPALIADQPEDSQLIQGAALGAVGGIVVGSVASQWLEVEPPKIGELGLSLVYLGALADGAVTLAPTDRWSRTSREQARVATTVGLIGGRLVLDPWIAVDEWQTPAALAAVGASLGVWTQRATGRGSPRHGVQLGAGVGFAAGALLSGRPPASNLDRVELTLGAAAGQLIGYGVADAGKENRATGALIGGAAGLGLSAWLAPSTRYDTWDGFYAGATLGAGSAYGAWVARRRGYDSTALTLTGGASGLAMGALLAQGFELRPADFAETLVLSAVANGVGHEVAWWAGADSDAQQWSAIATGSVMLLGWPWVAHRTEFAASELELIGFGSAFGALAGVQVARLVDLDGRARARSAGLGAGIGFGVTTVASQLWATKRSAVRAASVGASVGFGLGWGAGGLADEPRSVGAVGSLAAGVSAGVAGYALEGIVPERELFGAFAAATALSSGASMLATDETWVAMAAVGAGGLAGVGLTAAIGDRAQLKGPELVYVSLMTLGGAGQGAWGASLVDVEQGPAALMTSGAFALGSGAIAKSVELEASDVAETLVMSALAHGLAHEAAWLAGADSLSRQWMSLGSGAVVALGWPYLAGRTRFDATGTGFAATTAAFGAWTGYQLSGSLLEFGGSERWRASALGAGVGLVTGYALAQPLELDSQRVQGSALGAGIGIGVGVAAGQLALPEEREWTVAMGSVGLGFMGMTLGGSVVSRLELDNADAGLIASLAVFGAWHGAWSSQLFESEVDFRRSDRRRAAAGGAVAGALLGSAAGLWLSNIEEYDRWDVVETGLGWSASATFGGGLGLVVSEDDRLPVGLMQGVGIAGGIALARLAPIRDFEGEDMLVGSLTMGHLVWQGVGIGRLLELDPRQFAGTVMMSTAAGGLAGALAGDRLNLDTAETWAAFSGELWGSWLGAWSGFLYAEESGGSRAELVLGASAVMSNVGLLSSSFAVTRWDYSPRRMGWINLFGAAGALTGAATGALIPVDNNVQKGNVVGTLVGLGTGVVVTGMLGWGQEPTLAETEVISSAEPGKKPWMPEFEQVAPSFSSLPVTDPDWMPDDAEGFYLGVQGRWR